MTDISSYREEHRLLVAYKQLKKIFGALNKMKFRILDEKLYDRHNSSTSALRVKCR
jgi:hypothetical protein